MRGLLTGVCLFLSVPALGLALQPANATDYTIAKGAHYSSPRALAVPFNATGAAYGFTFDRSAMYDLGNADQLDVNKLAGFTDCLALDPQKHSARLGWRWNLSESPAKGVEILAFVDPGHQTRSLGFAPIGQKTWGSIRLVNKATYEFKLYKGATVQMPRSCPSSFYDKMMRGFKASPYFGGNQVAPHEIKIQMDNSSPPN